MSRVIGLISAVALAFTVGCAQTDSGITTKVKSKFAADDMVKAYQIDVDTADHVVTLRGDVETQAARMRAMELARSTDGVRDVVDQMVVRGAAATSGDVDVDVDGDADIDTNVDDKAADAARKTGDAAKEGANKVKDGAEKVGTTIRDAVTDKDRDSDNDGH